MDPLFSNSDSMPWVIIVTRGHDCRPFTSKYDIVAYGRFPLDATKLNVVKKLFVKSIYI